MSPPTDREWTAVLAKIDNLAGEVTALRLSQERRRGIESAVQWIFGGGLLALTAGIIGLWRDINHH